MRSEFTYHVLERAREISRSPQLDVLTLRKALGVPLAADIRYWLAQQPALSLLCLDFRGIRAVTLSVAEEVGPLLMQTVQQTPALEHRYPIYRLDSPEPAYTFAMAFANYSLNALALVSRPVEPSPYIYSVSEASDETIVILGQITKQMEEILRFADHYNTMERQITSDDLSQLGFLSEVSPAARSKRLTELYARRLLAFSENPNNPKERLFTPAWRI